VPAIRMPEVPVAQMAVPEMAVAEVAVMSVPEVTVPVMVVWSIGERGGRSGSQRGKRQDGGRQRENLPVHQSLPPFPAGRSVCIMEPAQKPVKQRVIVARLREP
jgi:hypothetical protein